MPSVQSIGESWGAILQEMWDGNWPHKSRASTTVSSPKSQIIVTADGAASEAIEGERKTVTALFADIKGSTELMSRTSTPKRRARSSIRRSS